MDMLELIKDRKTIRRYQDKPIPKDIMDKILEAGIWGPSLMAPGFQPWKFVVLEDKAKIKEVANILFRKADQMLAGVNLILRFSAKTIENACVIVMVYNSSPLVTFVKRIEEGYLEVADSAELAAISAAIQNMLLVASSQEIGGCWLSAPLFCKDEINELSGRKERLIALLTFGYPAEEGCRARRKPVGEAIHYI